MGELRCDLAGRAAWARIGRDRVADVLGRGGSRPAHLRRSGGVALRRRPVEQRRGRIRVVTTGAPSPPDRGGRCTFAARSFPRLSREICSSWTDGCRTNVSPRLRPSPRAGSYPGLWTRTAISASGSARAGWPTATSRSDRLSPTGTAGHCCCATAARRWTTAGYSSGRTCHDSSAPAVISPGPSATYAAWGSKSSRPSWPSAAAVQARQGDGWVKIVADWIDRERGDLAPVWPSGGGAGRRRAAHAAGARVTAHVFGEEALPDLIDAGIDCIEHGPGLDDTLIDRMARSGNGAGADAHQHRDLPGHRGPGRALSRLRRAHAAAARPRAPRWCGPRTKPASGCAPGPTPVGGSSTVGVVDEIIALHDAGLPAEAALAAGSWEAREWLGFPGALCRGRSRRLPRPRR